MKKPVQLLLALNLPDDRIQLATESEEQVVADIANLLLQVLGLEEDEEVEDEPCR